MLKPITAAFFKCNNFSCAIIHVQYFSYTFILCIFLYTAIYCLFFLLHFSLSLYSFYWGPYRMIQTSSHCTVTIKISWILYNIKTVQTVLGNKDRPIVQWFPRILTRQNQTVSSYRVVRMAILGITWCRLCWCFLAVTRPQDIPCRRDIRLIDVWVILMFHQPVE